VAAQAKAAGTTGARGIGIEFGQATDPGLDPAKRINEDSCGYAETKFGHLFVICDGMGGHAGGKQASDIAIRTVFDWMAQQPDDKAPNRAMVEAIEEAARRVYQFGGPSTNHQRPGSTCVALLLHDGCIDVAHVGDSRAYAIRGKQIYRLTRDHSMVQELVDNGVISEQEAIGHPDSNKITRALGMTPEVDVELRDQPMDLYEGDIFVLASDGLTDLARNEDILLTVNEYIENGDPQTVCNELVALANRRGGHDNITVQVVKVTRTAPRSSTTLNQVPADPAVSARRVVTTLDGSPRVPETMMQEPTVELAPPSGHVSVGPTVVQHPLPEAVAPVMGHSESHAPQRPQPTIPDLPYAVPPAPTSSPRPPLLGGGDLPASTQGPLIYVVLGMASLIGLLLALLIWALWYR
jgi:protein phosphatase